MAIRTTIVIFILSFASSIPVISQESNQTNSEKLVKKSQEELKSETTSQKPKKESSRTKTLKKNAQIDSEASQKKIQKGPLFKIKIETELEYNDNVFRLSESQKSRMAEDDQRDAISGRFDDMRSQGDFIITPKIEINSRAFNFLRNKFWIILEFQYNVFINNSKKRYPEGKLELWQSIGENGHIILESVLILNFFRKNYFSGTNALTGNTSISRAERIYSPAVYNKSETRLAYRHRLTKIDKTQKGWFTGFGISIQPLLGIGVRRYKSPFGNRNRNVILGGLEFLFQLGQKIGFDTGCRYEMVKSPDKGELILLDESLKGFNRDLNNDGKLGENALVFTTIHRSRNQLILDLELEIDFIKNWQAFADYRLRLLSYNSPNILDVDHNQRQEIQHRISVGITWRFIKKWFTRIKYERLMDAAYNKNYTENSIIALLSYQCL